MINLSRLLLFIFVWLNPLSTYADTIEVEEKNCLNFVAQDENHKIAHQHAACIKAANSGVSSAQYSVGMGYGFSGKHVQEEKYYRLAANNQNINAYLAMGHLLKDKKPWQTIYWYQIYFDKKEDGYGYAAILISKIFIELGDVEQAKYWQLNCNSSPYQDCSI